MWGSSRATAFFFFNKQTLEKRRRDFKLDDCLNFIVIISINSDIIQHLPIFQVLLREMIKNIDLNLHNIVNQLYFNKKV